LKRESRGEAGIEGKRQRPVNTEFKIDKKSRNKEEKKEKK